MLKSVLFGSFQKDKICINGGSFRLPFRGGSNGFLRSKITPPFPRKDYLALRRSYTIVSASEEMPEKLSRWLVVVSVLVERALGSELITNSKQV
jgi:hypothetical protein